MYCPNCGVNNDRGEKACYICGAALPSISEPVATPAAGKKRRVTVSTAGEIPATVGDRALALIFDRILLTTAAAAVIGVPAFEADNRHGLTIALSILIGTFFVYHVLLEGTLGTTLGKAMMGLRLRPGARPLFVGALLRNLVRLVDAQAVYAVGFLTATFTRHTQRLGDLAGGTQVMDRRATALFRGGMMALWLVLVAIAAWLAWSSSIIPAS